MTFGPGKYDDLCTYVREAAGIEEGGALVIIIGGKLGNGFSLQADFETSIAIADVLENVAKQIRKDVAG